MTKNHIILNYLDLPPRILLWPASEVACVAGPFMVLTFLGYLGLGVAISMGVVFGIRFYKRVFGKGRLSGFLYWYLPHNPKAHPIIPPSYVRELIG